MSTALYRRYRPQTFQDVIGQEQVSKPIMAALRAGRTAHAYLFSGPRGCGKTTSARILARCLNCAQAPTDTPCGECESCRELSREGSGSLDVVEMDAASHGGVDDARDLIERASFAPARDRYKIFIIDEAHMVSNQGFNALLKLVEEPPEHVKFIFATTEPEKVIGTIRSRTHHYPFRLVPPETLEHYLAQICEEEGVHIGAGVLPLVVRAGGGSVRDSLSVLDQLMGGADGDSIEYADAIALLGYTDAALLDDAVEALAASDGATLFSVVDRVVQSGHDPRRFVEDLLQRLRDLTVISLAGEAASDVLDSLPGDQFERMVRQAEHVGGRRASRSADLTNEALNLMVGATSPRLQLELLCARLLLPETTASAAPARAEASKADADHAASSAPASRPSRPASARHPGGGQGQAGPSHGGVSRASGPVQPGARVSPAWAAAAEPEAPREDVAAADGRGARSDESQAGTASAETPVTDEVATSEAEPTAPTTSVATAAPSSEPAEGTESALPQNAALVRQRWDEIVAAVQQNSRSTAALIQTNAQIGGLANGTLTLFFQTAGLATTFNERGDHAPRVARALNDVLGLNVQVHAEVGGGDAPKAPAVPSRTAPASNAPSGGVIPPVQGGQPEAYGQPSGGGPANTSGAGPTGAAPDLAARAQEHVPTTDAGATARGTEGGEPRTGSGDGPTGSPARAHEPTPTSDSQVGPVANRQAEPASRGNAIPAPDAGAVSMLRSEPQSASEDEQSPSENERQPASESDGTAHATGGNASAPDPAGVLGPLVDEVVEATASRGTEKASDEAGVPRARSAQADMNVTSAQVGTNATSAPGSTSSARAGDAVWDTEATGADLHTSSARTDQAEEPFYAQRMPTLPPRPPSSDGPRAASGVQEPPAGRRQTPADRLHTTPPGTSETPVDAPVGGSTNQAPDVPGANDAHTQHASAESPAFNGSESAGYQGGRAGDHGAPSSDARQTVGNQAQPIIPRMPAPPPRGARGGGQSFMSRVLAEHGGQMPPPPPVPEMAEELPEDDQVSPDDPTVAQSDLVGLEVVLSTFNGTVIEEKPVEGGGA
ncbi:MAG: DNA polymerase III subunit gamma and tau [Actinomycetaceae bacterium]|nr:DNA polymerase III subunit gamma and tau [Actinomycetaceae bacterium]